jgi:hypothetical protein
MKAAMDIAREDTAMQAAMHLIEAGCHDLLISDVFAMHHQMNVSLLFGVSVRNLNASPSWLKTQRSEAEEPD